MNSTSKLILLSAIAALLLVAVSVGGFFLWEKVDKQHEENVEQLSGFGSKVVPISQGPASERVTIGTGGQVQLPPSIREKKLSATEKIIISLSEEKQALVAELVVANEKIAKLQEEVNKLRGYNDDNQRFAPLPLQKERNRAITQLQSFFQESPDARRFSDFQTEAMTLASANAYMEMLRKYRLSFDDQQKDVIIAQHLPVYGFCVGNSIGYIPDNRQEEQLLLKFLRTEDVTLLSQRLEEDVRTITTPCQQGLDERVHAML
ncbi:hypothetical protein [Motiliproteus sp. SC1-56]|uniref:hypothetical protein n=1 Tax=Motiliproteus sp. SC1-56 TaxID=2799565 RepID=UPI001A8FB5F7|nr:hypothetical protein [Motiliproteus sp. SC1-56]